MPTARLDRPKEQTLESLTDGKTGRMLDETDYDYVLRMGEIASSLIKIELGDLDLYSQRAIAAKYAAIELAKDAIKASGKEDGSLKLLSGGYYARGT